MATVVVNYAAGISFNDLNLSNLQLGTAVTYNSSAFIVDYGNGVRDNFTGSGFTYSIGNGMVTPTGGVVTHYYVTLNGADILDFGGASMAVTTLVAYANAANTQGALAELLSGNDTISGGSGPDTLYCYGGDDAMRGGGGNDILDGGAGTDTVVYSGAFANYSITHRSDGSYVIVDNRSGSPDGTDIVTNFERVQFSDVSTVLTSSIGYSIDTYQRNALRADPFNGYNATAFASEVRSAEFSGATSAQIIAQIAQLADNTTSVATLSYQFFTGHTPTPAGLDYLVSPTGGNANNINSAYYQSFSEENRYINFAVNLGKLGEGAASFSAAYGSLSLSDATKKAYGAIYGTAPTDAKVASILTAATGLPGVATRADYFAYYGQDGANGIGTKAAMVGYLLVEAAKADVGTLQTANIAYLSDLAQGHIAGSIDLVGVYHGTAYTGG